MGTGRNLGVTAILFCRFSRDVSSRWPDRYLRHAYFFTSSANIRLSFGVFFSALRSAGKSLSSTMSGERWKRPL